MLHLLRPALVLLLIIASTKFAESFISPRSRVNSFYLPQYDHRHGEFPSNIFGPANAKALGTWYVNLGMLIQYKEEHGNCLVSKKFKIEGSMQLGNWVSNQRTAYSKGTLSKEHTQRLEELNFIWDPHNAKWDENRGRLVKYKEEHGNCLVPDAFKMEDGTKFGRWVSKQRTAYSKGTLSEEYTQKLEELGFVWYPHNAKWDENYGRLVKYKEENGDLLVRAKFKMEDGMKLGTWVSNQRQAYSKGTLSEEHTQRLEELGFVWDTCIAEWDENCGRLVRYKEEHGDCLVSKKFEMEGSMQLGTWVSYQRTEYFKGTLSEERTQRLEELGFVWNPCTVEWDENCGRLVKYKEEHGDCLVPKMFKIEGSMQLGNWVSNQRTAYSKGSLSEERSQRLVELGFVWDLRRSGMSAQKI